MRLPHLVSLIFGLLLALAAGASAGAQEAPTVLILDASGSMSAPLDGATRLDAARAVIVNEIQTWKSGRPVALVAYGHRRAGDCRDIETLVPLGPVDAKTVKTRLDALRARGKTPLSASLRQAAALLPKGGGSILLVSDGLETCQEDPCAVAEDLRKAHAGLQIHVVGFGLSEKDMRSLSCIAGKDGLSVDAQDKAGLSKALSQVEQAKPGAPDDGAGKVADTASPPVQPPPAPPAPVLLHLEAVVGERIVDAPVRWKVTTKGDAGPVYDGEARALDLPLVPGRYRVEVAGSNATGAEELVVKASDAKEGQARRVAIRAGLLRLSLVPAKGGEIKVTDIQGTPAYRIEPLEGQSPATVPDVVKPKALLAPGRYRVTGLLGPYTASATVRVETGKVLDLALDLKLGRITLEAAMEGSEAPVTSGTGFDWALVAADMPDTVLTAAATARPDFLAAAGRYTARLSISGATLEQSVEVQAGKSQTVRLALPSAHLMLEGALGPEQPPFEDWRDTAWTVTPKALLGGMTAGPALDKKAEAKPAVTLLPGTWTITLVSGSVVAVRDITLAPGARAALRVDLDAARLDMTARPAAGPPPINVVFTVTAPKVAGAADASPIFTGGAREALSTILPAGRYHLEAADETGRKAATDITLTGGQTMRTDLTLQ